MLLVDSEFQTRVTAVKWTDMIRSASSMPDRTAKQATQTDGRWWSGNESSQRELCGPVCRLWQGRHITSCVASIHNRRRPGLDVFSVHITSVDCIAINSEKFSRRRETLRHSIWFRMFIPSTTFAKRLSHPAFFACLLALQLHIKNYTDRIFIARILSQMYLCTRKSHGPECSSGLQIPLAELRSPTALVFSGVTIWLMSPGATTNGVILFFLKKN